MGFQSGQFVQGRDLNLDIKRGPLPIGHWCKQALECHQICPAEFGGQTFSQARHSLLMSAALPKACQWVLSKLSLAISSTVDAFTGLHIRSCCFRWSIVTKGLSPLKGLHQGYQHFGSIVFPYAVSSSSSLTLHLCKFLGKDCCT